MKIAITGRHVEVTSSLRDFVEKKVSKLEEFFSGVREVRVILSVEKYRHTAEVTLKAGGKHIAAKKTTKDMYASIEEVTQAISQQASREKEKQRSQSSRRHRGRPASVRGLSPADSLEPARELPEEAPREKVVRVKAFAPKPMSLEEALMEFRAGDGEVLAFVNSKNKLFNVVFRRKDGSLGLVESL